MAVRTTDWTGLERAIDGEVVLPGSAGWEAARRPALARFRDAWPAAVVRCATPGDVAGTIAFARQADLPLAARSGGHCFAGHSTTDGIVIDVGPMAAVAVDDGIATIGAGARLGAVYDALDAHGLAIPAGCGPTRRRPRPSRSPAPTSAPRARPRASSTTSRRASGRRPTRGSSSTRPSARRSGRCRATARSTRSSATKPELPRARPRGPAARIPRREPRAARARPRALRPRRRLPRGPVDPHPCERPAARVGLREHERRPRHRADLHLAH